ncbi:MAG: hypothetical protein WC889_03000 [Myxococcota bacterium]|jgi:hypothetical protein
MNNDKKTAQGEPAKPSPKAPKIGQRQAIRLCQMSPAGRLAFIAEGFPAWKPPVLAVTEAMSALGMFSLAGLKAVAAIWETTAFTGTESLQDSERLMEQLVGRLIAEGLPSEQATPDHVGYLYRSWPLPLYDVDLKPIPVTIEELKEEQERLYWAEVGDPCDDPW